MFKKWQWIFIIVLVMINLYFLLNSGVRQEANNKLTKPKIEKSLVKVVDEKLVKTAAEVKEAESNEEALESSHYINNVLFLVQAPTANWKDEREQDGCEEASAVIVDSWYGGEKEITKDEALKRILDISSWFEENTSGFRDNSIEDVVKMFNDKLKINTVKILENPTLDDFKKAISENKLILVPTNGQLLGNPYFSGAGPERHMIVLRGYDDKSGEFITNDPGTKRGENYRYSYQTVMNANLAYPSGFHEKIDKIRKAVIVVSR